MSKFGANSEKLEKLYRETGNPLYVWAALADYQVCSDGAPLPAWIMEYLREAAMALEFIADVEQPSEALRRVNVALRLTRSGRNEFAEYRQDIRGLNAAHIHDIRKELFRRPGGRPETAVVSNQWLEKALGLKSEGPDRRNPEDQRSRRVGELIARGRKLRSIMIG
jgi:hypothetical protein